MKTIFFIFLFFIVSCTPDNATNPISSYDSCGETNNSILDVTVNKDDSSPTGVYIPNDLEDCFSELDKMLKHEVKKYLAEENGNSFSEDTELRGFFGHMRLGLFLRNNWGLWGKNKLVEYFNGIGIFHPDDMSGIILKSYQRYLQKKPIKLDEQVKTYQNYWKITKLPDPFIDPENGNEVKIRSSRYLKDRYIYIGYSKGSDDIWIYEYDKGWYRPDYKLLKKLGYSNFK